MRDLREIRSAEERHSGIASILPLLAAAIPSLISAAPSILSGIIGAKGASKQQAQANEEVALQREQMNVQNALAAKQQALAEQQNRQGLASQTDAMGNRIYYDEATNSWKVDVSDTSRTVMDAETREQMRQLTGDSTMARNARISAEGQRQAGAGAAAGALGRYQRDAARGGSVNPSAVEAALRSSRTQAVNQGFDQVASAAGLSAARTGGATANAGNQSALARARAQQIAQTMGTPYVEGLQTAGNLNQAKSQQLIGDYNTLTGIGTQAGGATDASDSVNSALAQALAASKTANLSATNNSANIANNAANRIQTAGNNYALGADNRTKLAGATETNLANYIDSIDTSGIMNAIKKKPMSINPYETYDLVAPSNKYSGLSTSIPKFSF